ncbi:Cobalamin biosynthesis protein CobQ [Vibrio chagasii]|uniref:ParA family protein n=2 Tax=Vibrio TaxID=662 RepID=A0A7Y3YRU0_9VIBR|nr:MULTISPECIES: ParA family protein [Vibrio]MBJ2147023.1 ParA family protein [Vibrio sp. IB15]MCG9641882.1 ParA family protein [Vibrio sp. Isolate34]MCG9692638.1 ParA family protein [Vibrio sp. Isolate22]MDE9383587.1 ParA family protein [Vibrio alginolyticus]NOI39586.1 ParA family protein [Vibrio sp. 070316B]NOI87589.1 ParA family protein [Vibrio sp. 99K-1]NOI97574.1 ParA family protein [Vibrio sp. T3Y01]NVN82473.1 ParA family protein [Vibrio sp. Scap16]
MGRIVAIANQKGGVGKTTTCINLAASMAATKRKILVVDLDPQGNATMASGVDKYQVEATAYDLLVEDTPFDEVVCRSTSGNYDLIAANGDVTAAEIKLMEVFAREVRLKNALASIRDNYDFIFIDCPPSLNLLTINAMAAADSVLVPMQCEYFALEGLTALMDTISKLAAVVNENLKIEGLLRTMYDPRNRLSNEVSDQLKKHFGSKVYRTVIPRNVRLAEAPSHGKPAMYYDKYSAGAKAYLALAGEMLRREEVPV